MIHIRRIYELGDFTMPGSDGDTSYLNVSPDDSFTTLAKGLTYSIRL